eukprot:Nitzschia sp. Nitz4//scaffold23_size168460//43713//46110//NITZ4_002209-RA/size168460-snap-gene-0.81-mRNA-1//1//CDS//3329543605//2571//frame0
MASHKELRLRLKSLLSKAENHNCVECFAPAPSHGCLMVLEDRTIGSFCCSKCALVLRRLGDDICWMKSITTEEWMEDEVEAMELGGNKLINTVFEGKLSFDAHKPHPESDHIERERFFRQKYEERQFFCLTGLRALWYSTNLPTGPSNFSSKLEGLPGREPKVGNVGNDGERSVSTHMTSQSGAVQRRLKRRDSLPKMMVKQSSNLEAWDEMKANGTGGDDGFGIPLSRGSSTEFNVLDASDNWWDPNTDTAASAGRDEGQMKGISGMSPVSVLGSSNDGEDRSSRHRHGRRGSMGGSGHHGAAHGSDSRPRRRNSITSRGDGSAHTGRQDGYPDSPHQMGHKRASKHRRGSIGHDGDDMQAQMEALGYEDAVPDSHGSSAGMGRRGSVGGGSSHRRPGRRTSIGQEHCEVQAQRDALGYEDATPDSHYTTSVRRGSIGGTSSARRRGSVGGDIHNSNHDVNHSTRSRGLRRQGSRDMDRQQQEALGYEDCTPQTSRVSRRGSVGGGGYRRQGSHMSHGDSHPPPPDVSGASPHIGRASRRGSVGGLKRQGSRDMSNEMSHEAYPPPDVGGTSPHPGRAARRGSVGGLRRQGSRDLSRDLGYEACQPGVDAGPTGRATRRGSVGGLRRQNSRDLSSDLGYEAHQPDVASGASHVGRATRRGSVGGLRRQNSRDMSQQREDLGYEDCHTPDAGTGRASRRGSVGGSSARRRGSIGARGDSGHGKEEHVRHHDHGPSLRRGSIGGSHGTRRRGSIGAGHETAMLETMRF